MPFESKHINDLSSYFIKKTGCLMVTRKYFIRKKGHAKVQQFSLLVKNGIAESDKRKNVRVFKGAITPPFFKDLASKQPLKTPLKKTKNAP